MSMRSPDDLDLSQNLTYVFDTRTARVVEEVPGRGSRSQEFRSLLKRNVGSSIGWRHSKLWSFNPIVSAALEGGLPRWWHRGAKNTDRLTDLEFWEY